MTDHDESANTAWARLNPSTVPAAPAPEADLDELDFDALLDGSSAGTAAARAVQAMALPDVVAAMEELHDRRGADKRFDHDDVLLLLVRAAVGTPVPTAEDSNGEPRHADAGPLYDGARASLELIDSQDAETRRRRATTVLRTLLDNDALGRVRTEVARIIVALVLAGEYASSPDVLTVCGSIIDGNADSPELTAWLVAQLEEQPAGAAAPARRTTVPHPAEPPPLIDPQTPAHSGARQRPGPPSKAHDHTRDRCTEADGSGPRVGLLHEHAPHPVHATITLTLGRTWAGSIPAWIAFPVRIVLATFVSLLAVGLYVSGLGAIGLVTAAGLVWGGWLLRPKSTTEEQRQQQERPTSDA